MLNKNNAKDKLTLHWEIADGISPDRSGNGGKLFNLRSPLTLSKLPAGKEVNIDLGLQCGHPLLLVSSRAMEDRSLAVTLSNGSPTADAGAMLKLRVKNVGAEDQYIEQRDILARAFPLDASQFE